MRTALALALVVLAAGCGGGDERLTREEFTEQASAICQGTRSQLDEIEFDGDTSEAVASYAEEAAPLLRARLEELEALEPPEDAEEPYDAFLVEAGREVRALEQLGEAAGEEDQAGAAQAAQAGRQAAIRTAALALQLDIRDCVLRQM